MHLMVLGLLLVAAVFGPQFWARHILKRHSRAQEDVPGTGAELARHLLDKFGLERVSVERTYLGDHYDPEAKAVRLGPLSHDARSLTAVAVAAHEVGHALQDQAGYRPLQLRTRLVVLAGLAEKAGSVAMLAIPLVAVATRTPSVGVLMFLVGLAALGCSTLVHLVTLPVEWDASFGRALPVLRQGGYLRSHELPAARQVLRACALTYVAGSLASLLNLWRWIAILRR